MRLRKVGFAALAVACSIAASCSLTVTSPLKGIGEACAAAEECQGDSAECAAGRCVVECTSSVECPSGAACGDGVCDATFKVGFVYDGNPQVSGFARAHDEGRLAAKSALPWLDFNLVAQDIQKDQESAAIGSLISDGASAVFVTTSRFGNVAAEVAKTHPDVKFLVFGIPTWSDNFSGYVPRYHQAWYLAGVAYGSFAKSRPATDTKRFKFGFVGALPVPEVNGQLNAFTVGLRSVEPTATVDVVWLGGFVPETGVIEGAVDYLLADGNRFIVNRIGARNADLLSKIDAHNAENPGDAIFGTILDNADACSAHETYCLGGPTWNWGPLYLRVLSEMQRGTFDPQRPIRDSILAESQQSVVNLSLGTQPEFGSALRDALSSTITRLTVGGDNTFAPADNYQVCPTSQMQRPEGCVATRVEDTELSSMCWLVEGVVQRADPDSPFDAATNGLVPAKIPTGETWPPQEVGGTPVSLACN